MVMLVVMLSICKVMAEVAVLAKSRRYFVEVGWAERRRRQGQVSMLVEGTTVEKTQTLSLYVEFTHQREITLQS
jgi:hypothetical protein